MTGTTLVLARDAGAAVALDPVVHAHASTGRSALGVLYGAAIERLPALAERVTLGPEPSAQELDTLVSRADRLLSGTSMRPERDRAFWEAARRAGIRSVAVLDHWSSYAERFSDRAPFDSLPDRLAVMDETSAERLRSLGFPAERLIVTGHPHLDAVRPLTSAEHGAARERLGLPPGRRIVLFCSEPKRLHYGADASDPRFAGYTEDDALGALVAALAEVEPGALLALRPHPLEGELALPPGPPESILATGATPREWIAASDAVVGMTSVVLLEAARAGRAVLSLRPGGGPEDLLEVHAREIPSETDGKRAAQAVRRLLSGHPAAASSGRGDAAARRVLELLLG